MQNTFVTQVLPAGNLNPMKDGSMVPLPPGSIVPTVVNGSIIPVKTIPMQLQVFLQLKLFQFKQ